MTALSNGTKGSDQFYAVESHRHTLDQLANQVFQDQENLLKKASHMLGREAHPVQALSTIEGYNNSLDRKSLLERHSEHRHLDQKPDIDVRGEPGRSSVCENYDSSSKYKSNHHRFSIHNPALPVQPSSDQVGNIDQRISNTETVRTLEVGNLLRQISTVKSYYETQANESLAITPTITINQRVSDLSLSLHESLAKEMRAKRRIDELTDQLRDEQSKQHMTIEHNQKLFHQLKELDLLANSLSK